LVAAFVALFVLALATAGIWPVSPASAAAGTSRLGSGETLASGERLVSPNGHYVLVMQGDGNLVEYAPGNRVIWSSGTSHRESVLVVQRDSNIVIVAPGSHPVWATGTNGRGGQSIDLELQDDANIVAYSSPGYVARWASGSVAPSGAGSSTPVTPVTADSSGVPCASGTRDLGVRRTGGSHPVSVRLCAVPNLRSSGSESTAGTTYYVAGANGSAIVNSRVSGAVLALVSSARGAGLTLGAGSSFRTNQHQADLFACYRAGRCAVAAAPGNSNHELGLAIDFAGPDGRSGCTYTKGVNPPAVWTWLRAHASTWGFHQYSGEHWHFDTSTGSARC
jgi:hypothetical protein